MPRLSESRFWEPLLQRYARSPSIALCRVPELELLSRVRLDSPILDHCGGDGLIASLAFPESKIDACVDMDEPRLAAARSSGRYARVEWGDAGKRLPFDDGVFRTVFNNSGIEHIPDLGVALREISRVMARGGRLVMNVLNSRYFDHWPGPRSDADAYREWQPFFHALDETGWRKALAEAGFGQVTFTDYLPVDTGKVLADLDFRHSGLFLRKHFSMSALVDLAGTQSSLREKWRRRLGDLRWDAPQGQGVAFQISAERV